MIFSLLATSVSAAMELHIQNSAHKDGLSYQSFEALGHRKIQGETLSFSTTDASLTLLPFFGDTVTSTHTMAQMIRKAKSQGYEVLGGIAGERQTENQSGEPTGPLIQNGRVVCGEVPSNEEAGAGLWQTLGIKRDGSVVLGQPNIQKTLLIASDTYTPIALHFETFNRKQDSRGLAVYTWDMGSQELSYPSSVVMLRVEQGGFLLGEQVVCRVERTVEQRRSFVIEPGQVALAAADTPEGMEAVHTLQKLSTGQRVDILLTASGWEDVVQAVSGPQIILQNGQPGSNADASASAAITSLLACDGKGGFSLTVAQVPTSTFQKGLSLEESAQLLQAFGAQTAVSLKGLSYSRLAYWEHLEQPDDSQSTMGTCILVVKKKPLPQMTIAPPFTPKEETPVVSSSSSGNRVSSVETPGPSSRASQQKSSSGKTSSRTSPQIGGVSSLPQTAIEEYPLPANGIVEAEKLQSIWGQDKGIRFYAQGPFAYRWLFWGKDLENPPLEDLQLSVAIGGPDQAAIQELCPQAFCLSLAKQQPLSGRAILEVDVSSQYEDGTKLYVYGYRDGQAYPIASQLLVEQGMASFYVSDFDSVFLTPQPLAGMESAGAGDMPLPLEGENRSILRLQILIPIFLLIFALTGVCALILQRKGKGSETQQEEKPPPPPQA